MKRLLESSLDRAYFIIREENCQFSIEGFISHFLLMKEIKECLAILSLEEEEKEEHCTLKKLLEIIEELRDGYNNISVKNNLSEEPHYSIRASSERIKLILYFCLILLTPIGEEEEDIKIKIKKYQPKPRKDIRGGMVISLSSTNYEDNPIDENLISLLEKLTREVKGFFIFKQGEKTNSIEIKMEKYLGW